MKVLLYKAVEDKDMKLVNFLVECKYQEDKKLASELFSKYMLQYGDNFPEFQNYINNNGNGCFEKSFEEYNLRKFMNNKRGRIFKFFDIEDPERLVYFDKEKTFVILSN